MRCWRSRAWRSWWPRQLLSAPSGGDGICADSTSSSVPLWEADWPPARLLQWVTQGHSPTVFLGEPGVAVGRPGARRISSAAARTSSAKRAGPRSTRSRWSAMRGRAGGRCRDPRGASQADAWVAEAHVQPDSANRPASWCFSPSPLTAGLTLYSLTRPVFDRYYWPLVPPLATLFLFVPADLRGNRPAVDGLDDHTVLRVSRRDDLRRACDGIDHLHVELECVRCGAMARRRAACRARGRG